MNTMSFYELNKQAQAVEVTFSRKTKSYHSQTYPHIKTNQGLPEYTKKINKNS